LSTGHSSDPTPEAESSRFREREVKFEHSNNLPQILSHLRGTLLVSTYQAGKLVVLGTQTEGRLALSFHNFERAMGIAVGRDRIAVGAQRMVWQLRRNSEIAPQVAPAGSHDDCYLTRHAHFTGEIQAHELAWSSQGLIVVNTLFSCLATLDETHSFVPIWRPQFISALAAEDRCHLNGLAMLDGRPKYVTAMGQTDTAGGWRDTKATAGCVVDVPSGEVVATGLAMPHSPRIGDGKLYVLDSGRGRLAQVDLANGQLQTIVELPGYTRGLALAGQFALVGLSKIRERSTFGGVPIAEGGQSLRCAVVVVDLHSGQAISRFEFQSGVEEIFDVQFLPGVRFPAISGPFPDADSTAPIWMVPAPR
jgi:uncharacterized protein (TIGR03032 family)